MKIGEPPPSAITAGANAIQAPTTPEAKHEQAERLKAARDFEQIFLRKMLSSLEKAGHAKGEGAVSSGGDVYSSMVVGALADAISSAGGIGLADMIARSTAPKPTSTPEITAQPATGPPVTHPVVNPLVNEASDFHDRLKLPGGRP